MAEVCVKVDSKKVCIDDDLSVIGGENIEIKQHPSRSGFGKFESSIELVVKSTMWVRINKFETGWFLDHLEAPKKGKGYGKLGLAVFWALLVQSGAKNFALRFGGGENSRKFIDSLGFDQVPSQYVAKVDDKYSEGNYSIVIGDMIRPRRDDHSKDIQGISISYFPVEFFETNIDKYKVSKFDNRSFFQKIFSR